jgi:hypothetical protein
MSEYTPMEIKAGRILCDLSSKDCRINPEDNWNIYGHEFTFDAKILLDGVGANEMLAMLKDAYPYIANDALREQMGNLIAKATGVQA